MAEATTAPAARTADEIKRDPIVAAAVSKSGAAITDAKEFAGEITLMVARERIADVAANFKADGFTYLVDLNGIDYSKFPGWTGQRFAVAYMLYSFKKNVRIRLKTMTDDATPVPSVASVWKTANWHERETFDMMGIRFDGHPNLERILMWEGFNGHPLRKDFPVRGIDTGARIYPEVFPEGGGPKAGSTGKDIKDVNMYKGDWQQYGLSPLAQVPAKPKAVAPAPPAAAPAAAPEVESEGEA